VPPYPSDYPGPCRRCFALAPVKQKADSPLSRETLLTPAHAAVIEAAKALRDSATNQQWVVANGILKPAVDALRALEEDA
jgi:hypothetical protein